MDYKKMYEAALERAKRWADGTLQPERTTPQGVCETIFPELRESEEEKIRKEMIGMINECTNWAHKKEYVKYLEKQKENPKSADSIPSNCASDVKCENRWHKVGDSLPDNPREVLCKDEAGNYFIGRYYVGEGWEISNYDDEDKPHHLNPPVSKWIDFPSEKQKEQQPEVKDPFDDEQFQRGYDAGVANAYRHINKKAQEVHDKMEKAITDCPDYDIKITAWNSPIKQKEQIPYIDFVIKPHKGDDNNPYDMRVSEAQEYAIKRGFGIPFNDGEVYVDERHLTQTIGNILRWADEHPKEQKPAEPSIDELLRREDEFCNFKVFAAKQAKEHHISFVHDFEWNNFCVELLSYFNEAQKPESASASTIMIPSCWEEKQEEQKHIDYIRGIQKELLGIENNAKDIDGLTESQWVAIRTAHRLLGEYIEQEQQLSEWALPEDFEEAVYKVANFISPFDSQEEFRKVSHRFAEQLLSLAKKELDKPAEGKHYSSPDCGTTAGVWSEEDEHRRKDAIYFLECAMGHYADTSEIENTIDWLKSLRPQPKWKPSVEQKEGLFHACNRMTGDYYHNALVSLYDDLKKLMEE